MPTCQAGRDGSENNQPGPTIAEPNRRDPVASPARAAPSPGEALLHSDCAQASTPTRANGYAADFATISSTGCDMVVSSPQAWGAASRAAAPSRYGHHRSRHRPTTVATTGATATSHPTPWYSGRPGVAMNGGGPAAYMGDVATMSSRQPPTPARASRHHSGFSDMVTIMADPWGRCRPPADGDRYGARMRQHVVPGANGPDSVRPVGVGRRHASRIIGADGRGMSSGTQ